MSIPVFVIITMSASALISCKPRKEDTSSIRSSSNVPNTPEERVAWLLNQIETDLAQVEIRVDLAGDPMAHSNLDVQGLALADGSIDERQHMLNLAKDLESYAADKVVANRHNVEAIAEELEGLADILSGLSSADKRRAADAVSRVRAILASPPQINGQPVVQKPTTPTPTTPAPVLPKPRIEDEVLYCKNLGNGSWLPAIRNGATLGFAAQNGNQGFTKVANCQSAVDNSRNGLICSISQDDKVSPFRVKTGQMIGPQVGFSQTANCVSAVKMSNDTICLVDNRPGVSKFAKYKVSDGSTVDYWFDDAERCRRNDKSPDPKTACLDRCKSDYDRCYQRAQRLSGMDQTSGRIQCLHDRIVVCEKRCG